MYSENKNDIESIPECKSFMCGSQEKIKTELVKGTNLV